MMTTMMTTRMMLLEFFVLFGIATPHSKHISLCRDLDVHGHGHGHRGHAQWDQDLQPEMVLHHLLEGQEARDQKLQYQELPDPPAGGAGPFFGF